MLDIKTLETWLWHSACSIRGSMDAPVCLYPKIGKKGWRN